MTEIVIKEYWIGFRSAQYFVRHLMKKDFGHVYIICKDKFNWVQIDPRNASLEVYILPYKPEDDVPKILNENLRHRFIRFHVEQKINKWPNLNPFKMIHCVNIVKYVLGIRVWAVTPYKLYRKLLRLTPKQMKKMGIHKIELIQ